MACYANQELYDIMTTASDTMAACHDNPGQYPNGKTAGPAFCLFDQLGFVSTSNSIAKFLFKLTYKKQPYRRASTDLVSLLSLT